MKDSSMRAAVGAMESTRPLLMMLKHQQDNADAARSAELVDSALSLLRAALSTQEPSAGLSDQQVRELMQVAHKWAGPDANDSRSDELEMALRAVRVGAALEEGEPPIDMLLFCPDCGEQHIDAPESDEDYLDKHLAHGGFDNQWTNPPHKSHLCHGCGCIWRPANVPTNGVAGGIGRGKADTWLLGDGAIPTGPASLEALIRACYDDAAWFPVAEDPRTSDWMYDDNHMCAEAIRKRGVETAKGYVERLLAASPTAAPKEETEPQRSSVWEVWNKTTAMLFATREDAKRMVSSAGAAVGLSVIERHVFGRPIAADTQGDAKDAVSPLLAADLTLLPEVRQAMGEALQEKLLGGAETPDWFDSREIDRLIDTVEGTLGKFTEEAAEAATLSPSLNEQGKAGTVGVTDEEKADCGLLSELDEPALGVAPCQAPSREAELIEALQFYAQGSHFARHDTWVWDTVSGEPPNFYEHSDHSATVEDGSVAKMALAALGVALPDGGYRG